MNTEWSLDVFYQSYEDENFKKDYERYEQLISDFTDFSETLKKKEVDKEQAILTAINYMEQIEVLHRKLGGYTFLRKSTNTMDVETTGVQSRLKKLTSTLSKPQAITKKFIANISDLDQYIEKHIILKEYEFKLHSLKENSKYMLSDDVEEVISKLNLSAGSAFGTMHQYLTSTLEVRYQGKNVTLSEIRNLAYSEEKDVRKAAYEAELEAYEKIKDPISFSLNNIKTQMNTICELRGYESALEKTLKDAHVKQETLDAMLSAMREYMPKFHQYLRRKAEMLGYSNGLPWYELFAPVGESSRTFSIEEAKDYLVNHFRGFASDIADMIETAFDKKWIDFYPRKGKVGGAFCSNLPFLGESRVLTNFDGMLGDVVTLAHELGHAYHGSMICENAPLNWDYSMLVAETASNFNETVIMNAAIAEASGREKMALIENRLQDVTQIMCDIYSRFLFETEVFDKTQTGFLFAEELKKMMLSAQKEAYGNGLDHEYLHPYMWVNKGHYYRDTLSYYNFPYAFGGLFARGLYEKYLEEGERFLPKYRELLKKTTVCSAEDVAKIAGIDLENPEFWRKSLEGYAREIDEFIELSKQYK
ncbi:M3 family oligoendopeptidase [Anaeromicropila herbilytica]|uniref:Oligoendopeptidase F n=1 Tax=Anaeromicropila herbilytica TaxID=2785025 RepID=A0A7R7EIY1_9FIRM|nr:M3 family oligoendopeptidase [Anaeromicropila herbilytica]BCN30010.1 oligoendopeptidase F [Anaeromicropila herbilytica]